MSAGGKETKQKVIKKDSDLNAYILSYKGNEAMATRLAKQLEEKGFPHIKIVYAPDMAKEGMARNQVVFHTFREYVLPLLEKSKRDTIVFEDDADIYSPYSKYKELAKKHPMNRIAWWKLNRSKGKPQFLVGSTIVSYRKDFIPKLAEVMRKSRPQHIDGFLTKKFEWTKDWDFEPAFGFGGTTSHHSYIMGDEFRKGQTGSDAPAGYVIPEETAGFKRGVVADKDKPKKEK
tara:strand:+ start:1157 stop:1852 length:696 start_codon:yes stop_codon:yes gene_type:complete